MIAINKPRILYKKTQRLHMNPNEEVMEKRWWRQASMARVVVTEDSNPTKMSTPPPSVEIVYRKIKLGDIVRVHYLAAANFAASSLVFNADFRAFSLAAS